MRGCLGWVTLLLLVAAAVIVMMRSGRVDAWLPATGTEADSLAGQSGVVLDPRVQPYPTPRPSTDSPTADRLLEDVQGMGQMPTP